MKFHVSLAYTQMANLDTLKERVNRRSSGPCSSNPRALSVEQFFLGAQDPAPSSPGQDLFKRKAVDVFINPGYDIHA